MFLLIFIKQADLSKALNTTFFVLVPKKGRVEEVKGYRPISLVGSLYKNIAQVLAKRLKKVTKGVTLNTQHAFIKGRQTLDAVFIKGMA